MNKDSAIGFEIIMRKIYFILGETSAAFRTTTCSS